MPDRVIRDEILDSERYCNLSSDTVRMAFIHCLLLANDYGNLDGSAFFVRRRVLFSNAPDESVNKVLCELMDADLLRVYEIKGKRYLHIPRFRQRLRHTKMLYIPRPPENVECNEIKDLIDKTSDARQTHDRLESDVSQTHDRRTSAEDIDIDINKDINKEKNSSRQGVEVLTSAVAEVPIAQVLKMWEEKLPTLAQPRTITTKRRDAFKRVWHLVARQTLEGGSKRNSEQMLEYFANLFDYIAAIPFLTGQNERGWQMDFDWLCNQNNFVKVIEGKYDSRGVQQ